MITDEIMLKVKNVSKVYKLGEIGGTTLRDELQRAWAKIRKKEDPTKKIGAKNYNKGEKFKALDNISFEVKKGERIGIIGHNGAGKSTLLKLISRVTGPTEGKIFLNGRVASMLEVGTGFHPELTGRENVYMNGAILGMTKREIDTKMEDIIEFSEVRQFIDTPVKRYSSGMYVKLAFSVAAHLNSEIMIMDEVLAVGDMAFQKKCLNKMSSISNEQDKTILYVSHNMETIRQLCTRVLVLNHGQVVFFGDVEEGINTYLGVAREKKKVNDLTTYHRIPRRVTGNIFLEEICVDNESNVLDVGEHLRINLVFKCNKSVKNAFFRFVVMKGNNIAVAASHSSLDSYEQGKRYRISYDIDTSELAPDQYYLKLTSTEFNGTSTQIRHDYVDESMYFDIKETDSKYMMSWAPTSWGNTIIPDAEIINKQEM